MDIEGWLRGLGLAEYADMFRTNDIDFALLSRLTNDDLKDMGVASLGHRKKLLEASAQFADACSFTPQTALFNPMGPDSAERRQVTVMFSDLVGSTALSSQLDPEDLRELITAYQTCVAETVRRHGGFVAKYLGDGVLTYFGYPQAHEDDAEQAVLSGLEAIDAVTALKTPVTLRTRIGIATGLVVVGDLIGSGEAQERGIVGETPNLASRLQGVAEPNMVVIAEGTRKLLGDLFELKDLGQKQLNGIARPTTAFAALRAVSGEGRFEALHARGMTGLVGREEETDLLLRRWSKSKFGEGQVVLLSGEAGIGKSRLIAALPEHLAGEPYTCLRYFCSPQHADSAFYPIINQMERAAGVSRDDGPQDKLDKLDALLAQSLASVADAALFAELLSLPNDGRYPDLNLAPEQRRRKTLEAFSSRLDALSRDQPVLMIFEDAHWTDPTSLEAFGQAIERIRHLRVLLLITFRPEFVPPWVGRSHVTLLTINRMAESDVDAIIDRVAGDKQIPESVRKDIIERTDGIPLFVEEMTKAVLEAKSEGPAEYVATSMSSSRHAVPASLQASLMSRLDRLGPAKYVAQIGAALGREFSHALLAAVAASSDAELASALNRLVAAGLLFRQGAPPQATYLFKHALVRDASYSTLLRAPRRALHARIAEVLQNQFAEIAESHPELLARHCTEADLFEKAAVLWGKAGERSAARSAMEEAAEQFKRGLEQLAALPDSLERQRHELAFCSALGAVLQGVKGIAAPETGRCYARARELWEQLGSPSDFLQVPAAQSIHHMFRGEFGVARRLDEELLHLSSLRNDPAGLVLGYDSSGRNLMLAGNFAEARLRLENGLALFDPVSHGALVHQVGTHPHVTSRAYLGLVLFCLGFPDQALAQSEAAIDEARRLAHPPSLAVSLSMGSRVLSLSGDDAALGELADELVKLTTEHGFPYYRALGIIYRGWANVKAGNVAEGLSFLRSGSIDSRATGAETWMPYHIALLASAYQVAGKIEESLTLLDEALETVRKTGAGWLEAALYSHKGQLLLRQGHSDAAENMYREALSIAGRQAAKLWELRAAVNLARHLDHQGRSGEARDLLTPIYDWFIEGFDTLDLKEARGVLDNLHV